MAIRMRSRARRVGAVALCSSTGVLAVATCAGPEDSRPAGGADVSTVVGMAPPASGGIRSVVTLAPEPPSETARSMEPAVMDQFAIAFVPRLLVARTGQPVEFRNSEEVSHNVRVTETATDSMVFSANPVIGDPYVHTFDRAGLYAVACDIHPGMAGHLVVVPEPYAVAAAEDGAFSFEGVPPGRYRLRVWNLDPALRSEQLVETGTGTTEVQVERGGG